MAIGSTGLLIIRAYLETESPVPLRADIRLTSDVSAGIEREVTVVDVDRVAEVVRSWLVEDILKTPAGSRYGGVTPQ
jgi:cobalamin biosynthesis protein CobT